MTATKTTAHRILTVVGDFGAVFAICLIAYAGIFFICIRHQVLDFEKVIGFAFPTILAVCLTIRRFNPRNRSVHRIGYYAILITTGIVTAPILFHIMLPLQHRLANAFGRLPVGTGVGIIAMGLCLLFIAGFIFPSRRAK
jgi:hypothetical protein